jgi:NAD(P)-dependent dehydrogenase (short-subunit alcohol dehydrogenase family)
VCSSDLPSRCDGAMIGELAKGAVAIGRDVVRALPGMGPSLEDTVSGRTVMITGASSGIGRATALRIGGAGGTTLLVARRAAELERAAEEIRDTGGRAYVYPADLADMEEIDRMLERVLAEHASVDVLVNNAGLSIRRSVRHSYDRFHDYERTMQLNYFGAVRLIMGLLPGMRERHRGHIVNVSTLGVQATPPRFSAYIASKSALDAFTRVAAAEARADDVHFTTVHMPLVRTPMIEPTHVYDRLPALSPEQGAKLVCDAIRTRARQVGPSYGTVTEVAYAIAPGAVERVAAVGYSRAAARLLRGLQR